MRDVLCLLIAVGLASGAQTAKVSTLFDKLREAIRSARSDADVAALVAETKLSERLDSAVVEQLETEGAGPETLRALEMQQETTSSLRAPLALPKLFDAPEPPAEEVRKTLIEQARTNALSYTSSLPNFLCTQTVTRFAGNPGDWKLADTLVMSVAYTSKGERYKLLSIDGKSTRKTLAELGGFRSNGEFGSLLQSVFRPEAETEFRWERWTTLHGRLTHVFSFHIEQNRSSYQIGWKSFLKRMDVHVGLRGLVYVDAETRSVTRVVTDPEGLPAESPIRNVHGVLEYGQVDVGGRKFTLPTKTENRIRLRSGQKQNSSVFDKYRKFSGESSISFEPSSPEQ